MEEEDLKFTLKDGFALKDGERSLWIRRRIWPKVNESKAGARVRSKGDELLTFRKVSLNTTNTVITRIPGITESQIEPP